MNLRIVKGLEADASAALDEHEDLARAALESRSLVSHKTGPGGKHLLIVCIQVRCDLDYMDRRPETARRFALPIWGGIYMEIVGDSPPMLASQ